MEAIEKSVTHLPVDVIWQYYDTGEIPTTLIYDVNYVIQRVINDEYIIYDEYEVGVLIHALHKLFRILDPPILNFQFHDQNDEHICIDQCIKGMSQEYRILLVWLFQHDFVLEQHITPVELQSQIYNKLFTGLFKLNIDDDYDEDPVEIFELRLIIQLRQWWIVNQNNAN